MQHLQPNTTLQGGKYRIERVLGQGGFGITYLAIQEMLNRKVAIKEFFMQEYCNRNGTSVATNTPVASEIVERLKEKFISEASIIAKFRHPNIIDIYDVFIENDTAYYVMEFIEGNSLEEVVSQQGTLTESTAIDYIQQVGAALECMHKQKINHLDVKPSNIMLRNNKRDIVLIDFGISKQYDEDGKELTTLLVGISDGYTPIEQYDKNTLTNFSPQTDVYALGATLYKLLTGLTPPSALTIIGSGINFPESISSNLRRVLNKAMNVNKNNRFSSVSSFCMDLCAINNNLHNSDNESTILEWKSQKDTLYQKAIDGDSEAQYLLGMRYYDNKMDIREAIRWFAYSFQNGNTKAMEKIAEYANSRILLNKYELENASTNQKDSLFNKAVNGDANAQYFIGLRYLHGMDEKKNKSEAIKWFLMSAKQGEMRSLEKLVELITNCGGLFYAGLYLTKNK